MKALELHQMEQIEGGDLECGSQIGLGVGLMIGGMLVAATVATGGIAGVVAGSILWGSGLVTNVTAECSV
jgi:hypothetical protein